LGSPVRRKSSEVALRFDGEEDPVVLETFGGVDKKWKRMAAS
jgi:hypothetical protein